MPVLLVALLAGCAGTQSALDVHGTSAVHLKHLIFAVVAVCTTIWIAVMAVLAAAILRSRRRDAHTPDASEKRMSMIIAGAVCLTVVIVAGLTLGSFYTTRAMGEIDKSDLTIIVRAEQWWWRITYPDGGAALAFQTANEIHVPVGGNVRLQLESADVIHSFWVPSLAGKQDLVPGRTNFLSIRAERPGVYRGQCAEFCGLQHSHMAMLVIAEDEADFKRWQEAQRQDAYPIVAQEVAAGKALFLTKPCAGCHTIRGSGAKATTGPDLTHVGSRQTIAAGLLDRTRGSLAAWIADPQTLKPGNNMPMVPLGSDELREISAYMESLK
ncbi:cytochrome c oxidase subunit II [Rhizobium tubonense]|nr:cytochrome c oxidase subunit II [Rhizobium tubonense]